jgi:hypothetical protein
MTLPLGLHFGLPAEQHHADLGLGSSAIRALAENPFNYWWKYLNPARPEEEDDTAARINGRALHLLLYEGDAAFTRQFECGPDQRGMSSADKSASTKAANKAAASRGRECLKRDAYERIVMAHALITKNPDLATAFSGGMPEVTFIWERDGVRRKARFDYLKPVTKQGHNVIAVADLKSVANQYGLDFKRACRSAIGTYRYHAQAAHYLEAAALVPQAVKDNRMVWWDAEVAVSKATKEWRDRLAGCKHVAWQWVFHQTTAAPLTFSYYLSPGNPMLDEGRMIVERAITAYKENMAKYGRDQQWLMIESPEELSIEEMGWRP